MIGAYQACFESMTTEAEMRATPAATLLYAAACNVDRFVQQVVTSAEYAARDLVQLAQGTAKGQRLTSNPMASSRMYDLPVLIAQLDAAREAFWNLAELTYGHEVGKLKALRGAIEAFYAVGAKAWHAVNDAADKAAQ